MEKAWGYGKHHIGQLVRTETVWKVLPGAQCLLHSQELSQVTERWHKASHPY